MPFSVWVRFKPRKGLAHALIASLKKLPSKTEPIKRAQHALKYAQKLITKLELPFETGLSLGVVESLPLTTNRYVLVVKDSLVSQTIKVTNHEFQPADMVIDLSYNRESYWFPKLESFQHDNDSSVQCEVHYNPALKIPKERRQDLLNQEIKLISNSLINTPQQLVKPRKSKDKCRKKLAGMNRLFAAEITLAKLASVQNRVLEEIKSNNTYIFFCEGAEVIYARESIAALLEKETAVNIISKKNDESQAILDKHLILITTPIINSAKKNTPRLGKNSIAFDTTKLRYYLVDSHRQKIPSLDIPDCTSHQKMANSEKLMPSHHRDHDTRL